MQQDRPLMHYEMLKTSGKIQENKNSTLFLYYMSDRWLYVIYKADDLAIISISHLEIPTFCAHRDDNLQQVLMVINMLRMVVDGKLKFTFPIHHTHTPSNHRQIHYFYNMSIPGYF